MKKFLSMQQKNWKTSLAGLLIIFLQIYQCTANGGTLVQCITDNWESLMVAIALFFARDAKSSDLPKKEDQQVLESA